MNIHLAKNIIIYSICLLLIYYVYMLFHIGDILAYIFKLVLPIIIAIFIHFLLEPIINYFSINIKRQIVVIYLYLTFGVLALIIAYFILPNIMDQCMICYEIFSSHYNDIHPIIRSIYSFLDKYQLIDYLMNIISNVSQSVIYWISNIALSLGISFYLSYDNMHLIESLVFHIPFSKQSLYMQALKRIKLVTYRFMKSMLLDFICFYLLCLIPFYFIDQQMFYIIAFFLAVTNLIPYIGPYIGGLPIIIYEYFMDMNLGYTSFIAIVVLQYLESSYLQPYLFSKYVRIHPIILFIGLALFGDLCGIIGMVFSPLFLSYMMIIYDLCQQLRLHDKVKSIVFHQHT
ncbi:MAG: AI-2E family transporter [Erysipelotrichaceae bacterium]|nr:AI-2E family transporter [Erysipelotrichaceae bacterium]